MCFFKLNILAASKCYRAMCQEPRRAALLEMVIQMNFRKCCLAQENECWPETKPQKKRHVTPALKIQNNNDDDTQEKQKKEKQRVCGRRSVHTEKRNDSTLLLLYKHKKISLTATLMSNLSCFFTRVFFFFLTRTAYSALMKAGSRVKVANTTVPFPRTCLGPLATHTLCLQSCPRTSGLCLPGGQTFIGHRDKGRGTWLHFLSASPASLCFSFLVNFPSTM